MNSVGHWRRWQWGIWALIPGILLRWEKTKEKTTEFHWHSVRNCGQIRRVAFVANRLCMERYLSTGWTLRILLKYKLDYVALTQLNSETIAWKCEQRGHCTLQGIFLPFAWMELRKTTTTLRENSRWVLTPVHPQTVYQACHAVITSSITEGGLLSRHTPHTKYETA